MASRVVYEDAEVVVVAGVRGGRTRVVTFRAPEGWVEWVDSAARSLGKTRSELIREAVMVYLSLLRWRRVDGVHAARG